MKWPHNCRFVDLQSAYRWTSKGRQTKCICGKICEFGGDRCFGILAGMDFMLVCTYEKDGENPELLIYKKR